MTVSVGKLMFFCFFNSNIQQDDPEPQSLPDELHIYGLFSPTRLARGSVTEARWVEPVRSVLHLSMFVT